MRIEFVGSLAQVQSAINISAEGFTRVKFDIPESYLSEAVKLVLLKEKAFKVTIEAED